MENSPSPSIGRIVVYNYPGSADGKFVPKQSPAMVQKVNDDGTVEIIVFSVYGGVFFQSCCFARRWSEPVELASSRLAHIQLRSRTVDSARYQKWRALFRRPSLIEIDKLSNAEVLFQFLLFEPFATMWKGVIWTYQP